MNAKAIVAVAAGLLLALTVSASIATGTEKGNPMLKGYVLMGRNVVTLPEMLRSGDRMDFYDARGEKVLEEYVGHGYMAADISKLPQGAYTLVVSRNGKIVMSQMTPVIGMGGQ
jgi:hypothetical protein